MNQTNKAIENRWKEIKTRRFNDLTFIGNLDDIDLFINEPKQFFDPEVFALDVIEHYRCSHIKLAFFEKLPVYCLSLADSEIIYCFTNYENCFNASNIEQIFNIFQKKRDYKQIVIVGSNVIEIKTDFCQIRSMAFNLSAMLDELNAIDEIRKRYCLIEAKYLKKIKNLYEMSYSDFLKSEEYKNGLIEFSSDYIINAQNIYHETDLIKNKLISFFSLDNESEYLTLFFTSLYTNHCVKRMRENRIDTVDYTYAAITMYKIIEKVLYQIILKECGNEIYKDGIKVKDADEKEMMLRGMSIFLNEHRVIDSSLFKELTTWIVLDRNGFSHKHIMTADKYEDCHSNSYNLLVQLIDILY